MATATPTTIRGNLTFHVGMWLLIAGLAIYRAFALPETDIFWQVRAGQTTLTTGHIPTTALWGWLVAGDPWLPNSWLWNIIIAPAYTVGGLTGLGTLHLLICMSLFILYWRVLHRFNAPPTTQYLLTILAAVLLLPWLTLRPQEADYIFLLVFILLATHHGTHGTRWRPWLLPLGTYLLVTLWMNVHLTAPIALLLFPSVYWFISQHLLHETIHQRLRTIGYLLVTTSLGLLSTPYGFEGIHKALTVGAASRGIILEWGPLNLATPIGPITLAGLIIFGLLPTIYLLHKRQWLLAGYLLILTVVGVNIIRVEPYLILLASLTLLILPRHRTTPTPTPARAQLLVASIILLVGITGALPFILDPPASVANADPRDLQTIPPHARVLSLPSIGSEIILFRPDLSQAIDGRNDIYGKQRYLYLTETIFYNPNPQIPLTWLRQQHVTAVYFANIDPRPKLFTALQQAGWHQHVGRDSVIFIRSATLP